MLEKRKGGETERQREGERERTRYIYHNPKMRRLPEIPSQYHAVHMHESFIKFHYNLILLPHKPYIHKTNFSPHPTPTPYLPLSSPSPLPLPPPPTPSHTTPFPFKTQTTGLSIAPITTPCLTITLGFVAAWNVSLVVHSGPTGKRSERSYCWRVSKGWGSVGERYLVVWEGLDGRLRVVGVERGEERRRGKNTGNGGGEKSGE